MASQDRLKDLSERLEGTVNRIKELETKPTFVNRVKHHLRTQGSYLTNVLLAGCVLSIAMGRLGMKNQYEVEKTEMQEEIGKLQSQNSNLKEEVGRLRTQKQNIQQLVQRELDNGGWRLGPVASRLRASMLGQESSNSRNQEPPGKLAPDPLTPPTQKVPGSTEAKGKRTGLMI